jgi:hypothetical protein
MSRATCGLVVLGLGCACCLAFAGGDARSAHSEDEVITIRPVGTKSKPQVEISMGDLVLVASDFQFRTNGKNREGQITNVDDEVVIESHGPAGEESFSLKTKILSYWPVHRIPVPAK